MKHIRSKKVDTSILLLAIFIISIPVFMSSYVLIIDRLTDITSTLVHSLYSSIYTLYKH